jgi:hypothetical protein
MQCICVLQMHLLTLYVDRIVVRLHTCTTAYGRLRLTHACDRGRCCRATCCCCCCQVYIGGIFTAAVLDDIVMEPLTGRLMCVLYK